MQRGAGGGKTSFPTLKEQSFPVLFIILMYGMYSFSPFISIIIFLTLIWNPMYLLNTLYYHSVPCSLFCCSSSSTFDHWELFQFGSTSPWCTTKLVVQALLITSLSSSSLLCISNFHSQLSISCFIHIRLYLTFTFGIK